MAAHSHIEEIGYISTYQLAAVDLLLDRSIALAGLTNSANPSYLPQSELLFGLPSYLAEISALGRKNKQAKDTEGHRRSVICRTRRYYNDHRGLTYKKDEYQIKSAISAVDIAILQYIQGLQDDDQENQHERVQEHTNKIKSIIKEKKFNARGIYRKVYKTTFRYKRDKLSDDFRQDGSDEHEPELIHVPTVQLLIESYNIANAYPHRTTHIKANIMALLHDLYASKIKFTITDFNSLADSVLATNSVQILQLISSMINDNQLKKAETSISDIFIESQQKLRNGEKRNLWYEVCAQEILTKELNPALATTLINVDKQYLRKDTLNDLASYASLPVYGSTVFNESRTTMPVRPQSPPPSYASIIHATNSDSKEDGLDLSASEEYPSDDAPTDNAAGQAATITRIRNQETGSNTASSETVHESAPRGNNATL